MPTGYALSNGWFSQVFGYPVIKRDFDEPGYDAFDYNRGYPIGVLEHYTAGCGEDMSANIENRGYVICNFSVGLGGAIYQYTPLFRGSWHAHDAGENLVGIEFTCLPGSCNLTDEQYKAGVALNAAIVKAVKDLKGFQIPYDHISGCSITTPGFKEHGDGATPQHCDWDPSIHTDNPISVWGGGKAGVDVNKGWDPFLADVKNQVSGEGGDDELNDAQAQDLAKTADFVQQFVRGINSSGAPDDKATDAEKNGYAAGQKVWGIFQWQDGFTKAVKGEPKPSDAEAAKGWTAGKGG